MQILAYHKIGPKFDLSIDYQSLRQFSQQLKFLQAEGYQFVALENCLDKDFPEKSLAVTFDDGYENIYTSAFPVLQELAIPATVFMVTGFAGKYNSWDFNFGRKGSRHLSWEQIREMAKYGISFGSHTINHPDLSKLNKKYVEYELKTSKEILQDKTGQEVKFLSYPFGKYNKHIQEKTGETGYKKAFTLHSHGSDNNSDAYAIPRIGIYRFDTPLSLKIKLQGSFWQRIEDLKGNLINRLSYGTLMVKPKPKYTTIN